MFSLLYNKKPHVLYPVLSNFGNLGFLQCSSPIITRSFSSTIQNPKQLKKTSFTVSYTRSFSSTIQNPKQLKKTSFTVSYLIDSCGLSPEDAISASKRVQFLTPEKPDSVLTLFKKQGFSPSQITKIVKSRPKVLLANPENTVLSKIQFFSSIGITGPNLAELITRPRALRTSLSKKSIPLYKFLKNALDFDDDMLIKAMSNASSVYLKDVSIIRANLFSLSNVGMPNSVIQLIVIHRIQLLCYEVDIFRNKVKKIINMGFHPTKTVFIHALAAVINFTESSWRQRIEVYGRCGWSYDEIMSAFRKNPRCMTFSEKKIIDTMDFLVNVMEFTPSAVAATSYILVLSLEKRIIPWGLVVRVLMSKGIWDHNIGFGSALVITDKCFFIRYVEKHKEQIPYLVDVFEGRMSPQDLGFSM